MLRACIAASLFLASLVVSSAAFALAYEDYPVVRLRSLDKITARTMTFEAKVGSTVRFGEIYIKVQACRKPPPVEKTESAAFLQIWEVDELANKSRWIYSGWMFGSSPSLSAMDHPIYDVWVLECLGKDPEPLPPEDTAVPAPPTDGVVQDAQPPAVAPDEQPVVPLETPAEPTSTETPATPAPVTETPEPADDTNTEIAPPVATDQPFVPAEEAPVEETPAPAQEEDSPSYQGIY